MALTYEQCRSCGGRTQINPMVAPGDRRCVLCGDSCSEADALDAMEIPSAEVETPDGVPDEAPDEAHQPVELVAANCPHCESDIALDPDKPLARQRCHACGMLLEESKNKSRMRKRSRVSADGLLINRSRERVWMPIAGIMLALVFVAIFAIWMLHRPETQAAPPRESLPPDERVIIKELVARFSAARSPEELLPLIREPDKFEKPLRAWCAANPGALPLGGELLNIGPGREAFGVTLRQAALAWRELPKGLLLLAGTSSGWRVDWRAFEGTGDLSLADFVAQKPSVPALVMAVVRRSDFYNAAYADSKVWESLHLCDRMGDHSIYAYVPRSDAALLKSLEILPSGGRQGDLDPVRASRRLTLRLIFRNAGSATALQAEVTGVEGDGWYLP